MNNLKLKQQFRAETGKKVFDWNEDNEVVYTADYVNFIENMVTRGSMTNSVDKITKALSLVDRVCSYKGSNIDSVVECVSVSYSNTGDEPRIDVYVRTDSKEEWQGVLYDHFIEEWEVK